MSFDDDWVCSGECGNRVASRDGKGEGKVAGSEYGDRANREEGAAKVGPREGLTFREGAVDVRLEPRAGANEVGEEADLIEGAGAFASEPSERQTGFGGGPFEQSVTQRVDLIGDLKQEAGDLVGRAAGERERGGVGEGDGSIDLGGSRFEEGRGKFGSGGGIAGDSAAISFC
jgi:hypothetical protein